MIRDQSTFLTTWLASWGMVVAAPSTRRATSPTCSRPRPPASPATSTTSRTITLMQRENAHVRGPFQNRIEMSKIAVVGFDAGGRTVIAAAADRRSIAYVRSRRTTGCPSGRRSGHDWVAGQAVAVHRGSTDDLVPLTVSLPLYRATRRRRLRVADRTARVITAFTTSAPLRRRKVACEGARDQLGCGRVVSNPLVAQLTTGVRRLHDPSCRRGPHRSGRDGFPRHFIGPDPTLVGVGPAGTRNITGVT